MQRGIWGQMEYRPIRRLRGQTLALIGFGKLAQAVAKKAVALGLSVIAHDPFAPRQNEVDVELVSLDEALEQADIVSLHAPLLPETEQLMNSQRFALLPRGALFINAARGGLVDEDALVEALESGHVGGAGLDVFAIEPLSGHSRLRGKANVVLTPHLAFYSEQSLQSLQHQAAQIVADALRGHPIRNVVNR